MDMPDWVLKVNTFEMLIAVGYTTNEPPSTDVLVL